MTDIDKAVARVGTNRFGLVFAVRAAVRAEDARGDGTGAAVRRALRAAADGGLRVANRDPK